MLTGFQPTLVLVSVFLCDTSPYLVAETWQSLEGAFFR